MDKGGRSGARPFRAPRAMTSKRRNILITVVVLFLAAAPMFLILETDDKDETAASGSTATAVETVTALEVPADLPPIIYAANIDGEFRVFATDEKGSAPVAVLDEPATDPAWSPDGEEVLFVGEADGLTQKRLGLLAIRADRSVELVKKGPQIPSRISFRRGTGEVAVQSTLQTTGATAGIKYQSSVDSVNLETGSQKTIFQANGSAYSPAWSPDGSRLVVVAGEAGCRSEGICPQRLELLRPGGSSIGALTETGAAGSPDWSPDGTEIAFTWDRGSGPGAWIMDADGSSPRRITKGGPPVSDVDFSPDGRSIVFARDCELFVQMIDGRGAVNVTRSPEVCEITPDWRPGP